MKKTLQPWLAALTLASFALNACTTNPVTPTPNPAAQNLSIVAEGRLTPQNYVDLSFSVGGTIAEVLVAEGEAVTAGQALARLAPNPDFAAQLARAEQEQLAAAQAITALRDNAPLALAQAELAAITAAQTLTETQTRLEDLQKAFDSPNNRTKPTQLQLEVAAAQVKAVEAQLAAATDQWNRLKDHDGVNPDTLAAAEARAKTAQATLDSLQAAQAWLTLTAPVAGIVADLRLKVGERATPGQLAATIADLTRWVIATDDLTELDVATVKPGATVKITLDALPDLELSGTVDRIETRYEEKRGDVTYTTYIILANPDSQMRWGMTASVVFEK